MSRLGSLRQRKSGIESNQNNGMDLKLTLLQQSQNNTYEPTSTFTRTSNRLLKGRIQKPPSTDQNIQIKSINNITEEKILIAPSKLSLEEKPKDLKLVINDSPQFEKKRITQDQPKIPQKRILIAKEPVKQQPIIEPKPQKEKMPLPPAKLQQMPIKMGIAEEDVEDSNQVNQNQNDLIQCPEGCGRKFNRKALEKHAKACKLVFMSKRKEFNSEAKRISSKQQATMLRQNKIRQKSQLGKTKSKGFQKTGQNWKLASQEFRAAIKAIKKEDGEGQKEEKTVSCTYCEKIFNEVFLEQHLENCVKKKQQQKKITKKKK